MPTIWERYGDDERRNNSALKLFTLATGDDVSVHVLPISKADAWCKQAREVIVLERAVERLMKAFDRFKRARERAEAKLDAAEIAVENADAEHLDAAQDKLSLRETWLAAAEAKEDAAAEAVQQARTRMYEKQRECVLSYDGIDRDAALAGATDAQIKAAFVDLFSVTDPTFAGRLFDMESMGAMLKLLAPLASLTEKTPPANSDTMG